MSILIKDMEMPKVCNECPFCCNPSYFEYAWCELLHKHFDMNESYNKVADFCPITEVKEPHGRLIDIKSLEDNKFETVENDLQRWWNGAIDSIIGNAPTVIEAEGSDE